MCFSDWSCKGLVDEADMIDALKQPSKKDKGKGKAKEVDDDNESDVFVDDDILI